MSTDGRVIYRHWKLGEWEYRSDLISHDYMRRWMLKTPWGMLRLHKIMRSDSRDHFHDHPMDFLSLILRGGYIEHRPNQPFKMFLPGSVVRRRAEDLHYLELLGQTAWTFLITSLPRREWGFATEDGWISNDDYDGWLAHKKAARLKEEVGPYLDKLEDERRSFRGPPMDVFKETLDGYRERLQAWLDAEGIPGEIYDKYIEWIPLRVGWIIPPEVHGTVIE